MIESQGSSKIEIKKDGLEYLLPEAEALKPCLPNSTFAESPFSKGEFKEQTVEVQLQVAKEIIRQAIKIDYCPDQEAESVMAGDCSTAAKYLQKYLTKLRVPGNTSLVSVRRNPFNGEQRSSTRHIAVLHEINGLHRTVDSTAMVGYGYGTVGCECTLENGKLTSTSSEAPVYEDIEKITDNDLKAIEQINTLRRSYYTKGAINLEESEKILHEIEERVGGDYMSSWISEVYYIMAMTSYAEGNNSKYSEYISKVVDLDPLKPKVLDIPETPEPVKEKVIRSYKLYKEEVLRVTASWKVDVEQIWREANPERYHEALLKSQWIFRELKSIGEISDAVPTFNNKDSSIAAYNLNPRAIHENKMVAAWIKPNAFSMGVWSAAHEAVRKAGTILSEYQFNAGTVKPNGETPIFYTHPHALFPENQLAYTGPMSVMLVDADPNQLKLIKNNFRNEWGRVISQKMGMTINSFGGSEVKWNRFVTNYIHSAENAAETAIHFLIAYPHLSLVNRWDYPHPNL